MQLHWEWPHITFAAALALGLLMILGMAVGALGAGADADLDSAGADGDLADTGATPFELTNALLGMLGVGRVPLAVVLTSLSLCFGGIGLAASFALAPILSQGSSVVALCLAVVGSLAGTRSLARLVGRWIPSVETYAIEKRALVGFIAVAELPITRQFGVANLNASDGSLLKVRCISAGPRIEKGTSVLLLDFDPERGVYLVEPSPVEL